MSDDPPLAAVFARIASRRHRRTCATSTRRRILPIAGLVFWLAAMGLHWDLLQIGAWANMLQENLRALPTAAAVARTFEPEGMCRMCKAVQSARHGQASSSVPLEWLLERSPLLVPVGVRLIVAAPSRGHFLIAGDRRAFARRDAPPTPPPRAA